ncbi:prephenate dehydratase [Patescibacteria group bacterium]|nr:prephenate dehydratase [Patescibacteria group bacterium]
MTSKKDMTVGIIGGNGKMGRLFADFFRRNGLKVLISDLDTKLTNVELTKKADVVIVSVPIDKTVSVIKKIAQYVKKDAVLMDLTSVKSEPIKEMLKCEGEVIGLHPMFSDANCVKGQTIILCPARSKKWLPWIKNLFKKHNVLMPILKPEEHDKIMSETQGLIHFADIAFGHAVKQLKIPVKDVLKYASMASDIKVSLAARVLAQDAGLYGNIQIQNPLTVKALKEFEKSVGKLIKIVQKKDLDGFEKYFNESAKFLGKYAKEAYDETNWVIEQLLKRRGRVTKAPEKLPQKGDVGVMGPKYTYSDIAAHKFFKRDKKAYFDDIAGIFEATSKGKIKMGLVPIENNMQGTIRETLDELFKSKLQIVREVKLPIHHCLISLHESDLKKIKKIYSHPQAINQCGRFLKNRYKKAEILLSKSTAHALQKLLEENDTAVGVIGSREAAESHELKVLKENIEDSHDNKTTFVAISKKDNYGVGDKTSIAFYFSKDKPGSLFAVFKIFAEAKVNMTKIESRPSRKELGDYIFFLDFEGNIKETKIKKVLMEVEKTVKELRILGCYASEN